MLWVQACECFGFAGRTLEVLACGEALVRREHRPLLHGHPTGHADQTRLQVCGSRRGGGGEKKREMGEERRAGDVTKGAVTGEEGREVVAAA